MVLVVFNNRTGVTVLANLASKGCVRPTVALIGAGKIATLTARAFALTALVNVHAYVTFIQDEALRTIAKVRSVRVTVSWA